MIAKKKQAAADRHNAFVEAYFVNGFNGTDAYMATYPKCSRESARRDASRMLSNADIREQIQKRMIENQLSADLVLAILADHARASLKPFIKITDEGFVYFDFSQPGAAEHLHLIKKIKSKRTRRFEGRGDATEEWEDEFVEVELHDSQAALKLIGSHHKLFGDDKTVVNLNQGINIEGVQEMIKKVYGDLESG